MTGKTAQNVEMYNSYSNYIDAINGYDLTLTLDATIQPTPSRRWKGH